VRSLSLGRIAAQAELLRLRHMARRQMARAVLGAAALVFALAALAALHVAGAFELRKYVTTVEAVLIVAGIDAVIAIILGIAAARDVPGEIERQALQVRQTATEHMIETVALAALLRQILRVRSWREFAAVVAAALSAWVVGARR
jgi:hypothetical protein